MKEVYGAKFSSKIHLVSEATDALRASSLLSVLMVDWLTNSKEAKAKRVIQ